MHEYEKWDALLAAFLIRLSIIAMVGLCVLWWTKELGFVQAIGSSSHSPANCTVPVATHSMARLVYRAGSACLEPSFTGCAGYASSLATTSSIAPASTCQPISTR